MRTQRMKWTVGALALLGFLSISGASHAACEEMHRVSESSSSCMEGGYINQCTGKVFGHCVSWKSTFWATAYTRCTDGTDKVVVKIDIAGGTDKTWHLYDTTRRDGSASKKTRNVSCCSDLGRC